MALPESQRLAGHSCSGFTLVELVTVVLIIGILTAVAMPLVGRHIRQASLRSTMQSVQTILEAVERYRAVSGVFPANTGEGEFPPELASYLQPAVFTRDAPIGGKFDWNGSGTGLEAIGLSIGVTTVTTQVLESWTELDTLYDDGNLATGWIARSGTTPKHLLFALASK